MASTSASCSQELKDLRSSDTSCAIIVDSSENSDFAIATRASEVDHATTLTSYFSTVEEQIEHSKAHWSTLVDHSSDMDDEEVNFEVNNMREFKVLQSHPTWGGFFGNFTGDGISTGCNYGNVGELVLGEKFAQGGQAELYEAHIKWNNPKDVEEDRRMRYEWVLKVFNKGTLLKHVMCQLPRGILQFYSEVMKNNDSPTPKKIPHYLCKLLFHGILLKGGRFGFLMLKDHYDLRTLIEHNIKFRTREHCGPCSKVEVEGAMYQIAFGVEWLHNRDIVHRDLKASNVLVREFKSSWPRSEYYVADYECSIGVVGTSFFRAPEILLACKEQKVKERPEVFSRASDVYSYGMICYEILTGKLPFQDHPLSDSPSLLIDLVVNQHLRPEIPLCVADWIRELLSACWQFDPTTRPSIGEVLNILLANSTEAGKLEVRLKEIYGESFRM